MSTKAIAIFTLKSVKTILNDGGTASWVLDPSHARQYEYVVVTRNARARDVEGHEAHRSAFLVARIEAIVPASKRPDRDAKRWKIAFSQYAKVDVPGSWKGWRNPVRYATLEELGIDLASLQFQPMPAPATDGAADAEESTVFRLTLAQAKAGLANAFGVPLDAIEITIKS